MKTIGDGGTGNEVPNCTYSRMKAEKQTKTRTDDTMIEMKDSTATQQMVDSFVQVLIS